ncbi:hypothetical protein ATO4_19939 [Aurantimonas sp. 22II-16-19i]|nr:hypothetical protein ATO4_19939 [Aurantimonas sp. 22II-16-19i]
MGPSFAQRWAPPGTEREERAAPDGAGAAAWEEDLTAEGKPATRPKAGRGCAMSHTASDDAAQGDERLSTRKTSHQGAMEGM